LQIVRQLQRKFTNAEQLTLNKALQQDNQVFTRVHNTHLWLVMIVKNKPLTLSSKPYLTLKKTQEIFEQLFNKGGAPGKF
jgi:hypothetical protein